jgi:tyrosyl-tRNA synthetase
MVLAAKVTYSQISQRADFKKRLAEEKDFTLQEFIYPVLQGYDSVALKADLEIGGTDQKFNMLMGRRIQKRYKQSVQDVMTLKLLVGTDGAKKMSKTSRNFIGITESAQNQYGKIMSIPDHLMKDYFELCTGVPLGEIKALSPRETKAQLAREIVKTYHGQKVALKAEREFNRVFKEKKMPSKIPEFKIREKSLNILDLLIKTKLAPSKSEAKRLVEQGGVKIDNEAQKDWRPEVKIKKGQVLQVGKESLLK